MATTSGTLSVTSRPELSVRRRYAAREPVVVRAHDQMARRAGHDVVADRRQVANRCLVAGRPDDVGEGQHGRRVQDVDGDAHDGYSFLLFWMLFRAVA
jgi:hypothetical protein